MKNNIKKIILFSVPTERNSELIYKELFPKELSKKVFAYMPSDGNNNPEKFTSLWKNIAQKYNAKFLYINNASKEHESECKKLESANILLITGGNTFSLLSKLRKTGLDRSIKTFTQKENFVLAGFSAGALVLTPSIEVCNLSKFDPNEIGLKNLRGLGIVNFEIFPHYEKADEKILEGYIKNKKNKSKIHRISNDGYIIHNK